MGHYRVSKPARDTIHPLGYPGSVGHFPGHLLGACDPNFGTVVSVALGSLLQDRFGTCGARRAGPPETSGKVMTERIGRWAAGQQGTLVQEYLENCLKKVHGRRPPPGVDVLPEHTRLAALRAVKDGALGKAACLLSQVEHPLPTDIQGALRALHPPAQAPAIPPSSAAIGEDFTVDEVLECLRHFAWVPQADSPV